MNTRQSASGKMLPSEDQISQIVAVEIDPTIGELLEGMRLQNIQSNKRKIEWTNWSKDRLERINIGQTMITMMST